MVRLRVTRPAGVESPDKVRGSESAAVLSTEKRPIRSRTFLAGIDILQRVAGVPLASTLARMDTDAEGRLRSGR